MSRLPKFCAIFVCISLLLADAPFIITIALTIVTFKIVKKIVLNLHGKNKTKTISPTKRTYNYSPCYKPTHYNTKQRSGPGKPTYTQNGELVKSLAEARIANHLRKRGIRYQYEKTIWLDRIRIRPDFYLPQFHVYIEFYGMYTAKFPNYVRTVNNKRPHYEKNRLPVFELWPNDYDHLEKKIDDFFNLSLSNKLL